MDDFGGNVAAVANQVGIHVSVLYRKLKAWGTDMGAYRTQAHTFHPEGVRTVTTIGVGSVEVSHISHNEPTLSQSDSLACPQSSTAPTLDGMAQSAAAHSAPAPVGIVRKIEPARLTKDAQMDIQRFRLAYQAKVGREFTNSDIAEMHHQDTFAAWAASMLNGDAQ
jgi:transposase-like protein